MCVWHIHYIMLNRDDRNQLLFLLKNEIQSKVGVLFIIVTIVTGGFHCS